MRSPFPGMDPYIEACGLWRDFHADLIGEVKRSLAGQVPERYLVRTEERSYVVTVGKDGKVAHPFLPDIGLTSPRADEAGRQASAVATESAAEGEAVTVQAFVAEQFRETFIEVLDDDPDQPLVTCIEVLSPSNKRKGSKGWKRYLRKRQALLLGAANLVEIDLLRGGRRLPMLGAWPDSPYTLLVCREERAPYCRVWPAHYLRRLPTIPVPLRAPDADVTLDLQPMVEAIYARSRYHRSIDYAKPLDPPLPAADAAALAEALRPRPQEGPP